MEIIISLVAGIGLAYLLKNMILLKSKAMEYVLSVLLPIIILIIVSFILAATDDSSIHISDDFELLTDAQIDRAIPTFAEKLGMSMGKNIGMFGLGYISIGITFATESLKRIRKTSPGIN